MDTRGLSRIEVLVLLVIVAAVVTYGAFVLHRARTGALSAYDAAQIGQIHRANTIYARDNNGFYMTPGLVHRLPPVLPPASPQTAGINFPAIGLEDHSLNTSPNMYSAFIAQQYLAPSSFVGPTEVNPNVRVKDDYDYTFYPMADIYWDKTFRTDLNKPGGESNASYAHLAICGDRKANRWRSTQSGSEPVFSNRAPRDGMQTGPIYDESLTLKLHGPRDQWWGNVCFNDNHTEMLNTFLPVSFTDATGHSVPDNIFAADFDASPDAACGNRTNPELAGDAWLLIYSAIHHWPGDAHKQPCVQSLDVNYD